MEQSELKNPEWEAKQTTIQKLSEFWPIKCENGIYEFNYVELGSDGYRYHKQFRGYDLTKYIETKDGKDWTTDKVKPRTWLSNLVGMNLAITHKELQYQTEHNIDYHRRVWVGIMQRLIIENLQMETPISITEEKGVDFVTFRGRVYAHKNGTLNL